MRIDGIVMVFAMIGSASAAASPQRWSTQKAPVAPSSYRIDVPGPDARAGTDVLRQVDQIDRDIRDGRDGGQLSRRDARRLRDENHVIGELADRYAVGGTSAAEHRELETRAAVMRDIVGQQRLRPKR